MQTKKKETLSILLAFLGYAIFGFSFIFSKEALQITTPFVLLAIRFLVAFVILNLVAVFGRIKLNLKGKNIKLLLLLGILQPVVYFICENYGVKLLATSFVGIIVALVPVISLFFGVIILGEKARLFQILCAVVSVAGVFLTTLGQNSGGFSWLGFILILLAVAATSMFNVLSRRTSAEFSPFERTYVMFALGCVIFTGIALVQSWGNFSEMVMVPLKSGSFWISILYLSAASSVGAFLMVNYAVTYLDVARASIFANITTIISILAGVLILKESFNLYQIIGSIIIIACVYGVNRLPKTVSSTTTTAAH